MSATQPIAFLCPQHQTKTYPLSTLELEVKNASFTWWWCPECAGWHVQTEDDEVVIVSTNDAGPPSETTTRS